MESSVSRGGFRDHISKRPYSGADVFVLVFVRFVHNGHTVILFALSILVVLQAPTFAHSNLNSP